MSLENMKDKRRKRERELIVLADLKSYQKMPILNETSRSEERDLWWSDVFLCPSLEVLQNCHIKIQQTPLPEIIQEMTLTINCER